MIQRERKVQAVDFSGRVRAKDPVFFQVADDNWIQVGHIESVTGDPAAPPPKVLIHWYSDLIEPQHCRLTAFENRGELDDVLATMFPAEKRAQILARLEATFQAHGQELVQSLLPLVQQSLRESVPVIEAEFARSAERHRGEIDALMQRWNDDLVDKQFVPLAKREVIPIVRKHGQPLAESIGRELWDRASLWRFGWRAAYDKSPFPQRNLVQQEWDRFVEEEAIPVFDQHMEAIVDAVQRTVAEVAANETVRDEIAGAIQSMAEDPATIELFRKILRECIVDNPRLHQVWRDVWGSEQAQQALQRAGDRLEPVVRQIGDDLFGTREEGINPDFARVLRNQILGKDRRWLVATPNHDPNSSDPTGQLDPITIAAAEFVMPYPKVYLANRDAVGVEP